MLSKQIHSGLGPPNFLVRGSLGGAVYTGEWVFKDIAHVSKGAKIFIV